MNSTDIEQLYREHRPALVRWLNSMVRCEHTAADLAQEAYARLTYLTDLQSINSPRAYLFKTATNLAFDHFRKEKLRGHRQISLEEVEDIPTSVLSAEAQTYNKQRMATLEKALATLSAQNRAVFVLRRIYGHSYKEIAERLAISERAVERRLVKAMTLCQKALSDENEIVDTHRGENDALTRL